MLTVLTQKPLFSAGKPSDAHDLRHVQPRALGRKASDEFAVPLPPKSILTSRHQWSYVLMHEDDPHT
jgi:hypothetical protein